jgi:hypothetical protein
MNSLCKNHSASDECERKEEIVEVVPVILGGDPVAPENKMLLSRREHVDYVRYWNAAILQIKKQHGNY